MVGYAGATLIGAFVLATGALALRQAVLARLQPLRVRALHRNPQVPHRPGR